MLTFVGLPPLLTIAQYEEATNASAMNDSSPAARFSAATAAPVETSQEDNRGAHEDEAPPAEVVDAAEEADLRRRDPFLYFSNQGRRLAYLIDDGEDAADAHQDAAPQGDAAPPVQRRQRISFEIHPYLLIEHLLQD